MTRVQIENRISKLEQDAAALITALRSRRQEQEDIQEGLRLLGEAQQERESEMLHIMNSIAVYKRLLPRIIKLLREVGTALRFSHCHCKA